MSAKNPDKLAENDIFFHIYNKGTEGRIIFNDKQDYEVFIGYLRGYLSPLEDRGNIKKNTFKIRGRSFQGIPHQPKNYFNKVELIAYRLMPDQYHLLLHQLTAGSLENLIRSLCTRYAIYFNKKYNRTGALFQGPYKSEPMDDQTILLNLTQYLHYKNEYSSYQEYLGIKKTPWVKSEVVLSSFNNKSQNYKDFVEKYDENQIAKELIRDSMIDNEPYLEPRSRKPEFLILSTAIFVLLVSLGVRNINVVAKNRLQPSSIPAVLSETEEVTPELTPELTFEIIPEVEPEVIQTIEIMSGVSNVNIRQQPTTDSKTIGKATGGDILKFISLDGAWYQVKLANGKLGFISTQFILIEEPNN